MTYFKGAFCSTGGRNVQENGFMLGFVQGSWTIVSSEDSLFILLWGRNVLLFNLY